MILKLWAENGTKEDRKMKVIHGFTVALALILLAGCAELDLPLSQDGSAKTVITAGFAETRTVHEGVKVYWTSGDRIAVNGVESEALALDAPSAVADFTINGELQRPYKAVFPASAYEDENTVMLSSFQESDEDSFAGDALPMAAYAAEKGTALTFSPLCSILSLTIKSPAQDPDTDAIAFVEFTGAEGEQVSGRFALDYTGMTLTAVGKSESGKSVRAAVDRAATPEGIKVHIVVPPGRYDGGFVVKVTDVKGHYMKIATGSGRVLEKGTIYDMPAFEFIPTGTEFNVNITSAAELLDFARKWNAKEYSYTEDNPLVVNLVNDIEFTDEINAEWPGIGLSRDNRPFRARFNGNSRTISGFAAEKPLFGCIRYESAKVSDLTMKGTLVRDLSGVKQATNVAPLAADTQGGATVSNCHTDVDIIVTGSDVEQNVRVSGLVAYEYGGRIEDCSSRGTITVDPSFVLTDHYISMGQIAGFSNSARGEISDCRAEGKMEFKGTIQRSSASANACLYMGGIVGYLIGSLSSDEATATSELLLSTEGVCDARVGGLVGENHSGRISDVLNSGEVTFETDGPVTGSLCLGGVIGRNSVDLNGSGTIRNSGEVTWNSSAGWVAEASGVCLGGVVGYSAKSLSGLANEAEVTVNESSDATKETYSGLNLGGIVGLISDGSASLKVADCVNEGDVRMLCTGKAYKYSEIYAGGIVGYAPTSLTISSSSSSGLIRAGWNDSNKASGSKFLGGIVGYMQGASMVSGCESTGSVWHDDYNNSSYDVEGFSMDASGAAGGGIAGRTCGTGAERVRIEDCKVAVAEARADGHYLRGRRGFFGGVVGHATCTDIEGCQNTTPSMGASAYYMGGICGEMMESSMVGCYAETSLSSTQLKSGGGLVGMMDGTSSMSLCSWEGLLTGKADGTSLIGGLVGRLAAESTVERCSMASSDLYLPEIGKNE